jgi:hypothetical protein
VILIQNVLGTSYKKDNLRYIAKLNKSWFETSELVPVLDKFIGRTKFSECYTERFRTLRLANAGYYLAGSQNMGKYLTILPYNDSDLVREICRYHPGTRELRRLTISLLRCYPELKDIPVDTTHLKVNAPYSLHKIFRVIRMVMNVGYHKKIPLLQKGEAPKFRAFPYFDPLQVNFRQMVNEKLSACNLFDRDEIRHFIRSASDIRGFNFYLHHGAEANILMLMRLSYAESLLGGKTGR